MSTAVARADIEAVLRDLVEFAKHCEDEILPAHQRPAVGKVVYGVLVAQRRLATGVLALGEDGSYEARILLRSMIEHYFNVLWIRLRQPQRRANRYVKFHVIDKLKILDELPLEERDPDFFNTRRALVRRRSRYRHLFRIRVNGRLEWARSWALSPSRNGMLSFEARVREIATARTLPGDAINTFSYSLYRWFSAPAHGSAQHLTELCVRTKRGARPRPQPDTAPNSTLLGATVLLLGQVVQTSEVMGFSQSMKKSLLNLRIRCDVVAGMGAA